MITSFDETDFNHTQSQTGGDMEAALTGVQTESRNPVRRALKRSRKVWKGGNLEGGKKGVGRRGGGCKPRPSIRFKSLSQLFRPHGLQPARLLCPWDFPGKNTGVGYHFLLQAIFPT